MLQRCKKEKLISADFVLNNIVLPVY